MPSQITIRELRDEDAPSLLAYLERLPADDRRLRFFGSRVLTDQVASSLRLRDQGGVVLIAVQSDADGERCVGEGSLVPLADGTDGLALSVAPEVRGGAGGAMLDELRRRASARGRATIRGDVLGHNRSMLRLLRRRGGVTIDRDDEQVAIIVSTGFGAPGWPAAEGAPPYVLVEANGAHWPGERQLREAGAQVAVCGGPSVRRPGEPCPLLIGETCLLVDGADVIVHLLPDGEPAHRRVAAALPTDGPLVVIAPVGEHRLPTAELVADLLAWLEQQGPLAPCQR